MGKRYLHSIASPNTDLVAAADITPFDLPVNPLSVILLRLEVTNVAPAALLTYSAIDDVITQITNIRVQHKGEDIMQGSLRDLMWLNAIYQHAYPGWHKLDQLDNAVRSFVFPLCLGKRPYDPMSCFPATTRGNLRFFMTAGADGAAYDDINFSVETIELIEAQPTEYLKVTTNSRDSVVGQFDQILPIGNEILGILLFDTGLRDTLAATYSWGTIKLLKDNVEQYFPSSDIETLAAMLHMQRQCMALPAGHQHQISDTAGVVLSFSDETHTPLVNDMRGYAYLDFDPLRDGSYSLETAGAADLRIRGNGDAASAVRALPIERVMVR